MFFTFQEKAEKKNDFRASRQNSLKSPWRKSLNGEMQTGSSGKHKIKKARTVKHSKCIGWNQPIKD